jgi:ABC-type enterochelin transport system ATPase subunit
MVGLLGINERDVEGSGRDSGNCMERLRKATKNTVKTTVIGGHDLNSGPEYEARILSTRL